MKKYIFTDKSGCVFYEIKAKSESLAVLTYLVYVGEELAKDCLIKVEE